MRLAGGVWSVAGSHGPWVRGAAPRVVCGTCMWWLYVVAVCGGCMRYLYVVTVCGGMRTSEHPTAYTDRIHRPHTASAYRSGQPPGVEVRVGPRVWPRV